MEDSVECYTVDELIQKSLQGEEVKIDGCFTWAAYLSGPEE